MALNDFLRKHSIKFNISFILSFLSVTMILLLILYSIIKLRNQEIQASTENALFFSNTISSNIKNELDIAVITAETFAQMFESIKDPNALAKLGRDQSNSMLKQTLISRKNFFGIWTCWEPSPSGFDNYDTSYAGSEGHDSSGRYIPYFTRDEQGSILLTPITDYDLPEALWYNIPKETQKSYLTTEKYDGSLIFKTSIPIVYNSKFYGVAGVDVDLSFLQKMVDKFAKENYNGKSTITIITNEDKIAVQSNSKSALDMQAKLALNNFDKLKNEINKNNFFISKDTLYAYAPLIFGKDKTNWQVLIRIPTNIITSEASLQLNIFILIGIAFILIQIFIEKIVISKLINPINIVTQSAEKLALGDFKEDEIEITSVEIERLVKAFKQFGEAQKNITEVCVSIANGDLTKQANIKGEDDELGKAVNKMIENLRISAEEDAKRNWTTLGLAQFAEILRQNKTVKELTFDIISNLVKYVNANQGGVYIYKEEPEPHLDLVSAYAYERRKFISQQIGIGAGLVGQCYLEGSTIYLTEVPKDYIKITSGVGSARPTCVLIVPLKVNDKIEGIIEMASFKKFAPHEISFVEKVCESIAATLENVKINEKTSILLATSQAQTEEMRAQEEELRQNMEEMIATQEEMERKNLESMQIIKNFESLKQEFDLTNQTYILSVSDEFGNIVSVNEKLIQVSKYSREELIGKPHKIFRHPDMPSAIFKLLWSTIKEGKIFKGIIKNKAKDGSIYWVAATIVPIFDKDTGEFVKYIGSRYHIEDEETAEILYHKQIQELGF